MNEIVRIVQKKAKINQKICLYSKQKYGVALEKKMELCYYDTMRILAEQISESKRKR